MPLQEHCFLPPSLWGLHPLYNADVCLFGCQLNSVHAPETPHQASSSSSQRTSTSSSTTTTSQLVGRPDQHHQLPQGHVESDPDIRDSHFFYGQHPISSVQIAGLVTAIERREGRRTLLVDDGSGSSSSSNSNTHPHHHHHYTPTTTPTTTGSVQCVIFEKHWDGGRTTQPRARIGDAVVIVGSLGWGYKTIVQSSSTALVREVLVNRMRILTKWNELPQLWAQTLHLHKTVYSKLSLLEIMPPSTPFPFSLVQRMMAIKAAAMDAEKKKREMEDGRCKNNKVVGEEERGGGGGGDTTATTTSGDATIPLFEGGTRRPRQGGGGGGGGGGRRSWRLMPQLRNGKQVSLLELQQSHAAVATTSSTTTSTSSDNTANINSVGTNSVYTTHHKNPMVHFYRKNEEDEKTRTFLQLVALAEFLIRTLHPHAQGDKLAIESQRREQLAHARDLKAQFSSASSSAFFTTSGDIALGGIGGGDGGGIYPRRARSAFAFLDKMRKTAESLEKNEEEGDVDDDDDARILKRDRDVESSSSSEDEDDENHEYVDEGDEDDGADAEERRRERRRRKHDYVAEDFAGKKTELHDLLLQQEQYELHVQGQQSVDDDNDDGGGGGGGVASGSGSGRQGDITRTRQRMANVALPYAITTTSSTTTTTNADDISTAVMPSKQEVPLSGSALVVDANTITPSKVAIVLEKGGWLLSETTAQTPPPLSPSSSSTDEEAQNNLEQPSTPPNGSIIEKSAVDSSFSAVPVPSLVPSFLPILFSPQDILDAICSREVALGAGAGAGAHIHFAEHAARILCPTTTRSSTTIPSLTSGTSSSYSSFSSQSYASLLPHIADALAQLTRDGLLYVVPNTTATKNTTSSNTTASPGTLYGLISVEHVIIPAFKRALIQVHQEWETEVAQYRRDMEEFTRYETRRKTEEEEEQEEEEEREEMKVTAGAVRIPPDAPPLEASISHGDLLSRVRMIHPQALRGVPASILAKCLPQLEATGVLIVLQPYLYVPAIAFDQDAKKLVL